MDKKKKSLIAVAVGALTGAVNGFFGGGGGMIVVPMLIKFMGEKQKSAHAQSLAVILPVSVVSGLIYAFNEKIECIPLLAVTAGVCAGGAIGASLLRKLSGKTVGYIFCAVMLIAGVRMLF